MRRVKYYFLFCTLHFLLLIMLVDVKKINKYCTDYLEINKWQDYCVNGLQVEGDTKISKAITGVSISEKLIREAIKRKAKLIMVHHGIFKSDIPSPPAIKGYIKLRLKLLLEHNINLIGSVTFFYQSPYLY